MLNRAQPPTSTRAKELTLPTPQKYQIHPHLPLFVFQDDSQQVVQLEFVAQKGRRQTRLDNLLPYFMARTITEGTKTKSKQQIADHIDHHGASLHAATQKDTLHLRLTTLRKHFHHLIPLFAEILQQPSFPQDALALEKKIAQQDIQLIDATPQALAKKRLWHQAFGANHPYSYTMEEKDLALITRDALHQSFKEEAWPPSYCILSGHVDHTIIEATQASLATLPQKKLEKLTYTPQSSTKPLRIKKDNAVQASIAMGMPTITRTHTDYPYFYVLNMLLGGHFGSRLMQNIREEKGYTYGIGSRLAPHLYDGYFYIATEVKKGFAEKTCKEVFHEIKTLQDTLISTQELDALRDFLSGHLLAAFDNTFALANHFGNLYLQGLDLSHYSDLYQSILTIQPTKLQSIAQKYLLVDRFSQVIVNE